MSEKPISERLFLKKDFRFLLINDPPGYVESMGSLPEGLILLREPQPPIHVVQVFIKNQAALEKALAELHPVLSPRVPVWITYPKGTSGIKTDVNRDIIWRYVQTISMTANSMISIDDTWSAMRTIQV
jgi:hypothetical protein